MLGFQDMEDEMTKPFTTDRVFGGFLLLGGIVLLAVSAHPLFYNVRFLIHNVGALIRGYDTATSPSLYVGILRSVYIDVLAVLACFMMGKRLLSPSANRTKGYESCILVGLLGNGVFLYPSCWRWVSRWISYFSEIRIDRYCWDLQYFKDHRWGDLPTTPPVLGLWDICFVLTQLVLLLGILCFGLALRKRYLASTLPKNTSREARTHAAGGMLIWGWFLQVSGILAFISFLFIGIGILINAILDWNDRDLCVVGWRIVAAYAFCSSALLFLLGRIVCSPKKRVKRCTRLRWFAAFTLVWLWFSCICPYTVRSLACFVYNLTLPYGRRPFAMMGDLIPKVLFHLLYLFALFSLWKSYSLVTPRRAKSKPTVSPSLSIPMPSNSPSMTEPMQQPQQATPVRQKTLIGYVLFAWFFGGLGFHNFYALRTKCARTQLLMALLSFGILMPVCWLWAIIECCVVDRDGRGVPFG